MAPSIASRTFRRQTQIFDDRRGLYARRSLPALGRNILKRKKLTNGDHAASDRSKNCSPGVATLLGQSDQVYSTLEKAFYLAAEDGVWIRPGLKLEILDASIPGDHKPVVTFRITDDRQQTLDRANTPGERGSET